MITGDNVFIATAIATECGILKLNEEMDDGSVVEGVTFRNYTEEERMEKKGHVVAVTSDGTNDTPALKEVDIGLSMGIQGTEVAKESSDIVILDDIFASLATVLRWGRSGRLHTRGPLFGDFFLRFYLQAPADHSWFSTKSQICWPWLLLHVFKRQTFNTS
ncbi:Calcium-transporting ATPase [Forsythia ovata]|uniref:Calcium-transporting ATPase n=1 Tax=Forsythia ovata TaxID=205694 RepID=A0ABD1S0H4_9LAMI